VSFSREISVGGLAENLRVLLNERKNAFFIGEAVMDGVLDRFFCCPSGSIIYLVLNLPVVDA
jgi:hypothetical protein